MNGEIMQKKNIEEKDGRKRGKRSRKLEPEIWGYSETDVKKEKTKEKK